MTHHHHPQIGIGAAMLFALYSCAGPTTPGTDDGGYTPTWITAIWITSTTLVTDRIERRATENTDPICLPSALSIRPQADRIGFRWTCTQPTWVYACATEGQPSQPSSGFPRCAQDAIETPRTQLRGMYMENDGLEQIVPASGLRSLQLFYCGSQTTLSGTPLACS